MGLTGVFNGQLLVHARKKRGGQKTVGSVYNVRLQLRDIQQNTIFR